MEEIFPLTDQVNLLSETSRYALDNLLASHLLDYGTKKNAKISNNSNINNTNNTCNNITCSPLLSKKRQQSQQSFSRQSTQGMEHPGILKISCLIPKKNIQKKKILRTEKMNIYYCPQSVLFIYVSLTYFKYLSHPLIHCIYKSNIKPYLTRRNFYLHSFTIRNF